MHYYRYSVWGINIFLFSTDSNSPSLCCRITPHADLSPFVLFSLFIGYPLPRLFGIELPAVVLFVCSLASIIPLSYYIGMAISKCVTLALVLVSPHAPRQRRRANIVRCGCPHQRHVRLHHRADYLLGGHSTGRTRSDGAGGRDWHAARHVATAAGSLHDIRRPQVPRPALLRRGGRRVVGAVDRVDHRRVHPHDLLSDLRWLLARVPQVQQHAIDTIDTTTGLQGLSAPASYQSRRGQRVCALCPSADVCLRGDPADCLRHRPALHAQDASAPVQRRRGRRWRSRWRGAPLGPLAPAQVHRRAPVLHRRIRADLRGDGTPPLARSTPFADTRRRRTRCRTCWTSTA